MESALYGRMRLGECIKKNEHIGCSVDVLRVMDSLCSSRQNCTGIASNLFHQILKCEEMIPYLEASYDCLGGNISCKLVNTFRKETICSMYYICCSLDCLLFVLLVVVCFAAWSVGE